MNRWWPIVIAAVAAIACPLGVALLSWHSWQVKASEKARNIARSEADGERAEYFDEFMRGLRSINCITNEFPAKSRARRHGEKLATYCLEYLERHRPTKPVGIMPWGQAIANYLDTQEAQDKAVEIGIPVAALALAAKDLRRHNWCGSVTDGVPY